MTILENIQKAHDLLDDCNVQNDSGGCLFCLEYGYNEQGLKHTENCLIILLRRLIIVEKAISSRFGE